MSLIAAVAVVKQKVDVVPKSVTATCIDCWLTSALLIWLKRTEIGERLQTRTSSKWDSCSNMEDLWHLLLLLLKV